MRQFCWLNKKDNVIIAKDCFQEGECLAEEEVRLVLKQGVKKGDRIAIQDIEIGGQVIQYGYGFAISKGIRAGEKVTYLNTCSQMADVKSFQYDPQRTLEYESKLDKRPKEKVSFMGIKRFDGRVGIRNYYIVLPLSQCASAVAGMIADEMKGLLSRYPNIDGIVSLSNTEGCGCTKNIQIKRVLEVFANFISHPNAGRALVVDLGCEQSNIGALKEYMSAHELERYFEKVDFVSIEEEGGTKAAIRKGCNFIKKSLERVNQIQKEECGAETLIIATECGGSDAFSGITANSVIGRAVDYMIDQGASAILSEVPEMIGAEENIILRCRNENVASHFKEIMAWYQDMAQRLGESISDNLVPENIAGGLINPAIKSLGAVIKGGTRIIEEVIEYGEPLKKKGLNIMQGPGNDMESVTGMIASGAQIICFSTGKGTVTGSSIAPVIKLPSTDGVYQKLEDDMDINAGKLIELDQIVSYQDVTEELVNKILAVASGEKTKSERNRQHQFQIWTAGKLSV